MATEDTLSMSGDSRDAAEFRCVPTLVKIGGPDRGADDVSLYPLGEASTLGRARGEVDVHVDDPLCSREHAVLRRSDSQSYVLHDCSSRNGVHVQGRRLLLPEPIREGDVFVLGSTAFVLRWVNAYERRAIEENVRQPFTPVPTLSAPLAVRVRQLRTLARQQHDAFLTGETGAGKEVFAQAIHRASGRSGPFVAVNCAALPEALLESELFGYSRGAHSTAMTPKAGLVEHADRGTLLLDEIGDMSAQVQAKLLRFLQERVVTPLGATSGRRVDVQVVAATRWGMADGPGERGLRRDLAARLGPRPFEIPALRLRHEDIGPLVRHWSGPGRPRVEVGAYCALFGRPWAGNVRELYQTLDVAAAWAVAEGDVIRARHLQDVDATAPAAPEDAAREPRKSTPTRAELEALLERHHGNVAVVARALNRQRTLVWRWLRQQGCDPAAFKRRPVLKEAGR